MGRLPLNNRPEEGCRRRKSKNARLLYASASVAVDASPSRRVGSARNAPSDPRGPITSHDRVSYPSPLPCPPLRAYQFCSVSFS